MWVRDVILYKNYDFNSKCIILRIKSRNGKFFYTGWVKKNH